MKTDRKQLSNYFGGLVRYVAYKNSRSVKIKLLLFVL